MEQRYKVFINNRVIIITNVRSSTNSNDQINQIDYEQLKNDDEQLKQLVTHTAGDTLLYANDPTFAFNELCSRFHPIAAAGGLVKNSEGAFLFIFRNGKWDLPKGKLESDESVEEGAIREVQEECGITEITISKSLPSTYHVYEQKNTWYIKTTYWYEMDCAKQQTLTPQLEEGITAVEWIAPKNFNKVFENTYALIKDLASNYTDTNG